jgi:hypothetical protein
MLARRIWVLIRPLKNPAGRGDTDRPLTHGALYHRVLRQHAKRPETLNGPARTPPCRPT